jgi:hypothetical protein
VVVVVVVVVEVEVDVVLVPGASVVVGGCDTGTEVEVVESGAATSVVEVFGSAVVDGTAVLVAGAGSANVVDVAGADVTRLVTLAWSAGWSVPQLPTLPTAAVASRTDATVATSQATMGRTLRFTKPFCSIGHRRGLSVD